MLSRPRVAGLRMVIGVTSPALSQGAICSFSSPRFVAFATFKALKRREVCVIRSTYGAFPNINMLSSCSRFYCSFYRGRTSSVDKVCYKLVTDSSPAKMIPCCRDQNSFEGKPSAKGIFNQQKVDKRREQVSRNCSSTSVQEVGHNSPHRPHISSTATFHEKQMPRTLKLDEQMERLKKTKAEVYAHINSECSQEGNFYFQEFMDSRQSTSHNHKLLDKSDVHEIADAENVAANYLNPKNLALSRLTNIYNNVLVVDNITSAKKVVNMLTQQYRHLVHGCNTEVAKIDVKEETPVDHGEVICFSIYSGPQADFGNGKSCLWIDVLDGGRNLLIEFAPFFEDPAIKKVWHNYSFNNHAIENYGFKVLGFHADTMHMARLWYSSRRTEGAYSLEALTGDQTVMSEVSSCQERDLFGKVSMETIFGWKKMKKDGSEGKVITIPPVEELQRGQRKTWICYCAFDAINTLKLYESLQKKLLKINRKLDGKVVPGETMFDFYQKHWRPYGEILIKMETEGMLVDRAYLAKIEKVAKAEKEDAANRFRNWAMKYCPDSKYMNVRSETQLCQLLYGGAKNRNKPNKSLPHERIFKVPNTEKSIEEGKKAPTKFRIIKLHSIGIKLPTEKYTATGWPSVSEDGLKTLARNILAQYDFVDESTDLHSDDNAENAVEIGADEESEQIETLPLSQGKAFAIEEEAREACHAISSLSEVCSLNTLISNFIHPLQGGNVSSKNGRVHCSLNINTETGFLSSRRPNLQHQPSLEKDRYFVRKAFIAGPGNSLIVADYGQLELRILAHLANCESMLDAFEAGGDFHSRTAMNMYPHIRDAVEMKQVLLEWHPQPGEDKPPVPLLKDAFSSERRKAKRLNSFIAYGKNPLGLARDWKVSIKEAKETVKLWYSDKKEVLKWQKARIKEARVNGYVYTLLGRAHNVRSFKSITLPQRKHIKWAAVNVPVQGSAADIAMCAILEISKNAQLKELGWKLLLQAHNEVILEGPSESAEVAKAIVVKCMSKPFQGENFLRVNLKVIAECAQNWFSAKQMVLAQEWE